MNNSLGATFATMALAVLLAGPAAPKERSSPTEEVWQDAGGPPVPTRGADGFVYGVSTEGGPYVPAPPPLLYGPGPERVW